MPRFKRIKRACAPLLIALAVGGGACAAPDAAPQRVVSINLCTDQLALMLAAPGQLVSVSHLSQNPDASPMAAQAAALPGNRALAEEIYLYAPDLVIAGRYSSQASIAMLQRLGVHVAVLDPAYSLADVRARILTVGALLGRDARAARAVAEFDAGLARLRPAPSAEARHPGGQPTDQATGHPTGQSGGDHQPSDPMPTAASYAANGWTQGNRSLGGEIIAAAGFHNIAGDLGYGHGGVLPLELLVMADPDLVVTGKPNAAHSRAEEILTHPVLDALYASEARENLPDSDWICGTPHVLNAIVALDRVRQDLDAAK